MFFIKINIKGYLKNITENTQELIDTTSIKKDNKISYIIDNTKYILIIENTEDGQIFLLEIMLTNRLQQN